MSAKFNCRVAAGLTLLLAGTTMAWADSGTLTVKVDQPGVKISPTFYGLMTEEINYSYDGGLYAELIRNRSFKDNATNPVHWAIVQDGGGTGTIALDSTLPVNPTLTQSLKLTATSVTGAQRIGIANDGYWGIPVHPNTQYTASFYAKAGDGFSGPLTVDIESNDGATVFAQGQVSQITGEWKKYTVTLTTKDAKPSAENRFVISTKTPGSVWFSLVSLFPPTYKNRANGNRIDLMEKLAAMNQSFLRLPGGNYLEGDTIDTRFAWKDTIHDISLRPGHAGPWRYRSSDGLGILEFFEWCEDLHIEPVLAVFAGYALRGEHIALGAPLDAFVQEALDEIEYATGDVNTKWGAVRAADGHPAPFQIQYVEIGNEDFADRSGSYDGRFAQFYDAIKAKYPKLQLIATTHVKSRTPDVVDDHFYRSAKQMQNDVNHYDKYDRKGPKIFVGEWATREGSPTPNFNAALGDAAWLTGLERNSDVVVMEAYAPLLVNVNRGGMQWGTDLIGYNAVSSYGSPSYYVQTMFANNGGDVVLPVEVSLPIAPVVVPLPHGSVGVGTWGTQAEFKDIQVTQGGKTLYSKDFTTGDTDWTHGRGQWQTQGGVLRQSSDQTNTLANVGDTQWTDYTYSLKARKISGNEGFLISFHIENPDNRVWLNISGWQNKRTGLEKFTDGNGQEIGQSAPVTVETGRWYDIKIEVQGRNIRCSIDGKLIIEATDEPVGPKSPIFATASREIKTGDVILKVVNISPDAQPLKINLQGARDVSKQAKALVLTGNPSDVNSLENPEKIAPKSSTISVSGSIFTHEFPGHSISVLRVNAKK